MTSRHARLPPANHSITTTLPTPSRTLLSLLTSPAPSSPSHLFSIALLAIDELKQTLEASRRNQQFARSERLSEREGGFGKIKRSMKEKTPSKEDELAECRREIERLEGDVEYLRWLVKREQAAGEHGGRLGGRRVAGLRVVRKEEYERGFEDNEREGREIRRTVEDRYASDVEERMREELGIGLAF